MAINKTTQYTTDPNSIPVSISTGEQTLDDALEQRLTVSATEPSETFAYQRWWDTSIDQLKERSGDNLAWRIVAEVVSGELVPYSAGESVEGRYAGLASANTFTSGNEFTLMPSVGGDPVVESGSNSDGEWTRWADGTQLARNSVDKTVAGFATLQLPVSFTSTAFNICGSSSGSSTSSIVNVKFINKIASGSVDVALVTDGNVYATGLFDYVAQGRWK